MCDITYKELFYKETQKIKNQSLTADLYRTLKHPFLFPCDFKI